MVYIYIYIYVYTFIILYLVDVVDFYGKLVGKYTSPMDPMGITPLKINNLNPKDGSGWFRRCSFFFRWVIFRFFSPSR